MSEKTADPAVPERLSSRKFLSLVAVFVASCVFGWFRPEFVGTFQNLSTFWIMILGIYFGANVTEKWKSLGGGIKQ